MSSKNISSPLPDAPATGQDQDISNMHAPVPPPSGSDKKTALFSPFWRDRLFEAGLVVSMVLYYVIGNPHIPLGVPAPIADLNPLFSLPFLLLFGVLCWYRLSFAVALLPLSLPFYGMQKLVFGSYNFSLAEITLATCLIVALLQLIVQRRSWPYRLSWPELRDRLGPFIYPILVFFVFAAFSVVIAYAQRTALRAFREEVFDPLLYLALALFCLRSRQDLLRLFASLVGAGLVVAVLGIGQYVFFKNSLPLEADGVRRVHAVYGSANSIGLLLDYVFPLVLAFVVAKVSWRSRIIALALCIPLLGVLYLSQSHGAQVAIALAALFIIALSIRNRQYLRRKYLLIGAALVLTVLSLSLVFFRAPIFNYFEGHINDQGISTVSKRLYLWQSALNMIHDSPWLGYGMDNWLCHYSENTSCPGNIHHYWILTDPKTGQSTGLIYEPGLSHPHNIFLDVWVSIGVFGLLAFVVTLILFYWLFARILLSLRAHPDQHSEQLRWMTIGIGAAMVAAVAQGLVDSSFLEQDLAFCFWTLVALLLLVRVLAAMPWKSAAPLQSSIA
ncbi:MAG TPA: O-antigen ligase family protein [Ktedonobacteraceae bacterium]|nr:O-antigen ligase family protein [Ktedonobacteraceae bacterium]